MSHAQDSLSASHADPASSDSASTLVAGPDREPCGESGMNDGADSGGHTLLSRAPAPQGRRSLFRR